MLPPRESNPRRPDSQSGVLATELPPPSSRQDSNLQMSWLQTRPETITVRLVVVGDHATPPRAHSRTAPLEVAPRTVQAIQLSSIKSAYQMITGSCLDVVYRLTMYEFYDN